MKNLKRGGLARFFVIVSICFSIYPPGFPPSQGSFQAYAQEAGFFGEVFHFPEAFDPDYEEMERKFTIFVIVLSESQLSRLLTKDPEKAHLFLIPISCHSLPAGRSEDERAIAVEDFVKSLISKYPYWNRTLGADHFFITCADINVTDAARITNLMKNSIKVMCTPSYNDEYVPHKDVSLPQRVPPLVLTPAGNNITNRITLAFWRGLNNSDTRQKLLGAWENDLELFIQKGRKPSLEEGDLVYHEAFNNSKYCICTGGPELDRTIALAIHYGCVPVIMSDYYDLPFKDFLDWRKFSIILEESRVYYLREHLEEMLEHEYRAVQTNTVMVRKHFQWNLVPAKYDAFHMTLYDLWLRNHFTKYY
ncbi:PREDICTED: probable glycosyltransferase At3g07620 [Populus euphratica]|uniref:Probable glycosyltransferase At3g07620 n=1 Tax=Populus euphratica TaxID=75702 RepID=A0AAJ6U5L3_POPEU|nr:PREDICTED: probable glycosyltransferase At3g07620 [Populus euphratica]